MRHEGGSRRDLNYYTILGVRPDSSVYEIKQAYVNLVKQYHPDRNKSSEATGKMAEINLAYETLCDPEKRREYDLENNIMRRTVSTTTATIRTTTGAADDDYGYYRRHDVNDDDGGNGDDGTSGDNGSFGGVAGTSGYYYREQQSSPFVQEGDLDENPRQQEGSSSWWSWLLRQWRRDNYDNPDDSSDGDSNNNSSSACPDCGSSVIEGDMTCPQCGVGFGYKKCPQCSWVSRLGVAGNHDSGVAPYTCLECGHPFDLSGGSSGDAYQSRQDSDDYAGDGGTPAQDLASEIIRCPQCNSFNKYRVGGSCEQCGLYFVA